MISKYSVKRPYTVLVAVALTIVLGYVSLSKMTADLLPDMSFPYALIITTDIGVSPEKVETEVTSPIESAMATTSNIKNITSTSYNSYSIVVLEYEQNANMDSVLIEIQQSIEQLKGNWKDNVGSPVIMQINPDMLPIMSAAVSVDGMDTLEITDYVNNKLKPALESVEGVASVNATGSIEEKVQVTLNKEKINKINENIQSAISSQFADAQDQIDDGKVKLESGQDAMKNGVVSLTEGADQITDKKKELYSTRQDLTNKLSELNEQKSQLSQIYDSINQFIASDEYKNLEILGSQPSIYQIQLVEADKQIAERFAFLSQMGINVSSYKDLAAANGQIATMLTQVNVGISTIETALTQVDAGQTALNEAMDTLNYNGVLAALQAGMSASDIASAKASLDTAQSSLDSAKESALNGADLNNILTVDNLSGILTAQNFNMPAGYANNGSDSYLVRVGDSIQSTTQLKDLILIDMNIDGIDPIHLSDIADISAVDDSADNYAVINGKPGILLSMEKQTGYATGDVTDRLLKKFDSLEKTENNLHFSVLMNQGVYIGIIVKSVIQNMVMGAILAVIVLLLFLKDIKPTLVIACSIPLSVIASIVLMYFTGVTLNIISMSGLALGIGMLVDNSIVVIENIYRLRSEGLSVKKAAVAGAGQVAGAIFASTLTTISVFAPIVFTEGITRQMFVDMGLTIAFTLLASLVVALTFVPAMGSAILRNTKEIKHKWFEQFKECYGKILEKCLKRKAIVFITVIALLAASGVACVSKGLSFMDMEMESEQMTVTITAKEGEKLDFKELTNASDEVISRISDIKGIKTIGALAGGNDTMSMMSGSSKNSVSMYIILEENAIKDGKKICQEITKRTKDMDCLVKAEASAMDMSSYFASGLSVKIAGNDIDKLQELALEVSDVVKNTEGTKDVKDGLSDVTKQFSIIVDKEKAAKYGYTVAQVYQKVYAQMADSKSATTISTDIKDYEVYVQSEEQKDTSLDQIKNLTFTYNDREGNVTEVPISDIAEFKEGTTLGTIYREGQQRYINVTSGIDSDHNVTLVSKEIKNRLNNINVPEGYSVEMKGEDETINDAMQQLGLMLILAVIFIYLIMVAQFQSLLSPFIVMFTIPLAFTGGFIALFVTGNEISVIAMLGFIMLSGLIVNNGIVLIDYINQERRAGKSKKEAIIEAGKIRVRPILMTALTTIISMSTMALGIGSGSEMMQPMAITMIGGLIYGTLLTLIVVPCIYDAFHREKNMMEEDLVEVKLVEEK